MVRVVVPVCSPRHLNEPFFEKNLTLESSPLSPSQILVVVVVVVAHNLSSCHRTAPDANLLDDPHTFRYNDYFVDWRNPHLLRSFRRSNVPVDFFEFLSAEFAACPKSPSRDNHRKASYPRTQQRDQGVGGTQAVRSGSS